MSTCLLIGESDSPSERNTAAAMDPGHALYVRGLTRMSPGARRNIPTHTIMLLRAAGA